MNGFLVIDKPYGITSHDVVNKLRKILKTKKIGHTGTLDPIATGIIIACIGNCTKASNYLIADDKTYEVEIKLGVKTDTGDITGKVLTQELVNVSNEQVLKVINSFIGKQEQIPPIYSAIKVNGKKLYEYAREGLEVQIPKRQIEIFKIKTDKIDLSQNKIKLTVHCSKGTYIRSLCEDIGTKLGTVATMETLRRIQSGNFKIDQAVKLEEINEKIKTLTLEYVFKDSEEIILNEIMLQKLLNGVKICIKNKDGIYRIYSEKKAKFIGLGSICDNKLKREIIL